MDNFPNEFIQSEIVCGVIIMFNIESVHIFFVYAPPPHKISNAVWPNIFGYNDHRLVILADFNAHHISWRNAVNDWNGNGLLNFID